MSTPGTPSDKGVNDINLGGLGLSDPNTPGQGFDGAQNEPDSSRHGRGNNYAYGVRPANYVAGTLMTPRRDSNDRVDDGEQSGGTRHWGSRPMHRMPQTPRSRHSGRDAQNEYPSSACVFIANLPQGAHDENLHSALEHAFGGYGQVFIKVRRDGNNMPFAFAQFTRDEDAQAALDRGRDTMIIGRPCRVERPRAAQISHYITRHDGVDMTREEALNIMSGLGRISHISLLDDRRSQLIGLNARSFAIQYEMWDAGRNVVAAFQDDPIYRVDTLTDLPRAAPRPPPSAHRRTPHNADRDRRTIWISNLDATTTDQELLHLVVEVGNVRSHVIKPVRLEQEDGHRLRAYAFVEFENEEQAQNAVARLHNTQGTDGEQLRVERKRIHAWYHGGSQSSLRNRYIKQEAEETPTRRQNAAESTRRTVHRHESPTRTHQAAPAPSTAPPPLSVADFQSVSAFSGFPPASAFPGFPNAAAFPGVPTPGPAYHLPHPSFQYQLGGGMPLGGMPYHVYGAPPPVYHTPSPYDPMAALQTYTAPPYMMGGYVPSESSQGPTTRSEPGSGGKGENEEA